MSQRTLKITSDFLIRRDACDEGLMDFEKAFPDGIEVTEELAVKHAMDFDWAWAIHNLLTSAGELKARKLFNDEDDKLDNAILETRAKAEAAGWSLDATRAYWVERDRLDEEYEAACARIFAQLFIEQNGRPLMAGEES